MLGLCYTLQLAAVNLDTISTKARCARMTSELQLLMVKPTSSYQVAGPINGTSVHFMPDTGTSVTLVWEQVKSERDSLTPWTGSIFVGVEGTPIPICGTMKIVIQFAG